MEENTTVTNKPEDDVFVFEDIWRLFLSKWYWFALSLFCALTIATVMVLITPPTYTRSASLLVKTDDKKGGGASALASGFEDLGFMTSKAKINNEMLSITAPIMMEDVVKRLRLDVEMQVRDGFHQRVVYEDAPVSITINGVGERQSLSFEMELLSAQKAVLTHFHVLGKELEVSPVTVDLGRNVTVPFGSIRIDAMPNIKNYLNESIQVVKYDVKAISNRYFAGLSVSLGDKEADILVITMQDLNVRRADDVIKTLIEVYNENWIKDKNQVAIATSRFIDERLGGIEKDLGGVDNNISEFKSRNLLPDVGEVASMYIDQAGKNNEMLIGLTNQLSMAHFVRKYLIDGSKTNQLLPSNTGIEGNGIEKQITEYNTATLRRNDLVAKSNETNPLVVDIDRGLAQMRTAIVHSLDNHISLINTQITNSRATEGKTNAQIATSPKKARELLTIERQQQVKQSLYIYLLQKREENELSKAYTASNSRIIQPPSGSDFPTAPKKSVIFLAAFALGLVVPGAILLLLENMNTAVRGRHDLDKLTIPYIGEIPQVDKKQMFQKRDILVKEKGRDIVNEAFRIVRSKLDYLSVNTNKNKVFMFTSFNPGSGKTFVSMNLAMSQTLAGKKVAYVDLDIRRASASLALLKKTSLKQHGVSSYLSGQVDSLDDITIKSCLGCDNFDMIPVGVIPPNPAELLLTDKLQEMIDELRLRYDYIFLDCPPVEIVADTAIIEKVVDSTIFIVRVGLLDRRLLPDIETLYRERKYKNMAVILNGSEYVSSKYGYRRYSYKYGYNYGSGSGYYSSHTDS
ncbi:MAG: polysaccharide biosynthesis tyrosine autokinase [Bacteroidaceae bacterium]